MVWSNLLGSGIKGFDTFIIGNDYRESEYENCAYHKELLDGFFIYLLLYVDDILITCKNMSKINKLKTWL